MPARLGNFISKALYDSRLGSKNSQNDTTVVRFVDVPDGEQVGDDGGFWVDVQRSFVPLPLAQITITIERKRSRDRYSAGPTFRPRLEIVSHRYCPRSTVQTHSRRSEGGSNAPGCRFYYRFVSW